MFPIGSSLAAAREARGLTVRDAEHLTCMRSRYLLALEEERWDELPGRTYARAFLRTYAAALELDADKFLAEFDEQHPEPVEEEHDEPRRRRRPVVPLAFAPIAAVLALAIVFVWSAWSSDDHPSAASPPVQAAHAATKPAAHPVETRVKAARKTLRAPQTLVVRAVGGSCWVQARLGGPTGTVLAERTLEPGQSLRFGTKRIWLRLGAPWHAQVTRGAHTVHLAGGAQPVDVSV